jgi:Na+/melibiose symporter-like transporter/DNA-binding transcriptional ArsR family regulator
MSLESSRGAHVRGLLQNRDLRLLLAAGLVSQTGDWILGTGIAFQIYALTGSTVASAVALLATQAPQVVFGSVAGVLVDRWDRRRVMIIVNLLLAVVLGPLFFVHDASQVWLIVVVVAVSSCLTPFFVAAEITLLPALVQEHDLVTANAVNAQVRNVSRLVGAALGGVVIAAGGLWWLALVDVATFVASAVLLGLIRHRSLPTVGQRLHLVRDWVEGLTVIRRSRTLVVLLVFFAVSGVGEAVMGTLFAPFVQDVLGGTAGAFGTIMAAQAIGGIAGGLVITAVGHRFPPRALFAWGAVAFGVGDLALFLYPLLTHQVWPAVVIIAVVGLPGAALFAGLLTLFQLCTDDRVRGRVYGAFTTVQNLAMLASTFAAGALAGRLGILPVITVQGAAYLVAGVVIVVVLRSSAPDVAAGTASGDRSTDPGLGAALDNPAVSTRMPSVSLASNVRTRTVTEPLALRALAHPLRLQLHTLVAREGSLTAADAARQLGVSHALASHHLRQLAKYGFVEPADSPDQRSHPWRVTSTSYDLRPAEPEAQAAVDVLDRYVTERATHRLAEWQERRGGEDPAWVEPAGVRSSLLYLTPQELSDLMAAWHRLVVPLAESRPIGHADHRPAGAVPVDITMIAVPVPRTEQGG